MFPHRDVFLRYRWAWAIGSLLLLAAIDRVVARSVLGLDQSLSEMLFFSVMYILHFIAGTRVWSGIHVERQSAFGLCRCRSCSSLYAREQD